MATPLQHLPPPALIALRAGTADRHRAVDQHPRMRRLLGASPSLDDYGDVLQCLHQLHVRFEPAMRRALEAAPEPHAGSHKLPSLESDLRALGRAVPERPWPEVGDTAPPGTIALAQHVGTFYVLEGASLGGQVLARHLAATLGPSVAGALRYYTGHGAQTRLQWARSCDSIARSLVDPPAIDLAVRQALQVFRVFEQLLDATDPA